MAITAKSVYRDAGYFFRNQFVPVLLLSLLCAFISTLLIHAFSPAGEQIRALTTGLIKADATTNAKSLTDILQNLTPEHKNVLAKSVNISNLALLVGNVLLTGGLLALISQVSAGQRVSALRAIGLGAPGLPRLFILLFLMTLMVEIGALFLVVPGLFLALLFALAPVILTVEQLGIFHAIRTSARLALRHLWLIAPMVLVWIVARLIVKALLLFFLLNNNSLSLMGVLVNVGGNLVSAMLLIYLFRLYMLLRDTVR